MSGSAGDAARRSTAPRGSRTPRELYLAQLGTPDRGGGHVELLAAGLEFQELEEAVCGWREAQDDGDHSLDWLRDRVRRLTANGRALAAG